MTRRKPEVRALKPNQREREQRLLVIDTLIARALRGVLTIPEAVVLADCWRAERRVDEQTRRSLSDTTRALGRHREAAEAEIRRLEERVAELSAALDAAAAGSEGASEALCGPVAAWEPECGDRLLRDAADGSERRTEPRRIARTPQEAA